MCIKLETTVEIKNLLVDEHLVLNTVLKLFKLLILWLFTIEKNKADLCESAAFNKIFDCVATIVQMAISGSVGDG
mgnify:CR=1 FL=1